MKIINSFSYTYNDLTIYFIAKVQRFLKKLLISNQIFMRILK